MPSELDFERLRLVGKGSFGEAFLVRSRLDGRQYVMKIAALGKGERMRRALSEVDILIKCGDGHRNVCAYRGSFLSGDGSKLCILMDFYEGGDLRQKVKRRAKNLAAVGYFSEDEVLGYLTQLCDGLNHIHERNILHRDLKSQNVFVTQEGGEETLKIGDFGISTELEGPEDWARTRIGTPYYLSPEICEGRAYNAKSDMWSLGCIVYELCALRHAFDGDNLNALALRIMKGQYDPLPAHFGPDLRKLVQRLLARDPQTRPSAAEVLDLPMIRRFQDRQRVRKLMEPMRRNAALKHMVPQDISEGGVRPTTAVPRQAAAAFVPKIVVREQSPERGDIGAPADRHRSPSRPQTAASGGGARQSHTPRVSERPCTPLQRSPSPAREREGTLVYHRPPPHPALAPRAAQGHQMQPPLRLQPTPQIQARQQQQQQQQQQPQRQQPPHLHIGEVDVPGEECKPGAGAESPASRAERLRMQLEQQLGFATLMKLYSVLRRASFSWDDEACAQQVRSSLAPSQWRFVPLVQQLIAVEDSEPG